ncbi:uncharacterized protein LOC123299812 isoform X2 [Chrysoperla carnea]|uniref:uncharacterized protein LOC123299812 isoform X2 n=1 Tax=Chrysoperla carnea TaxID=189513 RepID=UPI001D05DDB5|nr:uncharacterized protein LOC123299812 isoform X2 [Chrysoperla carnea]
MVSDTPKLIREKRIHTMVRELRLWDDMKEYWGFYLLKGSTVTVSTCTRWPGSSLTVIRGHKHLHECAYIGDDSSEEIDELMESIRESNIDPAAVKSTLPQLQESETNQHDTSAPSNRPTNMKRHRSDVQFHDVKHNLSKPNENHTLHSQINEIDDHDLIDKKQMTILLAKLYEKSNNKRVKVPTQTYEDHIHKYRNQSVNQDERNNLKFASNAAKREHTSRNRSTIGHKIHQQPIVLTPEPEKKIDDKTPTSEEVFQRALNLIEARGDKGKRILQRLVEKYNLGNSSLNQNQTKNESEANLKKLLNNAFHEHPTTGSNQNVFNASSTSERNLNISLPKNNSKMDETRDQKLIREKRDLVFKLAKNLNTPDEEKDAAFEEGLSPDGIADHHEVLNETTLDDRSNSEFWSSFSSSEEALLNCAGLILNLPLTPHMECEEERPNSEAFGAKSLPNRITYTVPSNGYYFFVFNSENEVQENYLRIQFDLHKTVYDVNNSVARCLNSTGDCSLNLQFFSNEKLVLELPIIGLNDSQVSEEYVVISECEPRTSIYVVCVLAVPLVILLFAFQ